MGDISFQETIGDGHNLSGTCRFHSNLENNQ